MMKKLLGKLEARTVANICKITAFAAVVAMPFTMYPFWHEEAELPKSLVAKLR